MKVQFEEFEEENEDVPQRKQLELGEQEQEELEEEPEEEPEEEVEPVREQPRFKQPIGRGRPVGSVKRKEEPRPIRADVEEPRPAQVKAEPPKEPQMIAVPRAVSVETMFNEIYDGQQEIRQMLMAILERLK